MEATDTMSRVRLTAPQPPAIGVEGLHLVADELGVGPGLGPAGHADPHLAGLFVVLEVRVPVQAVAADEVELQLVKHAGGHQLQAFLDDVQGQPAAGRGAAQPGPP